MTRYVVRRVLLAIVTLWLICTIVFVIVNVLPSDVGRSLAGPFAPQETVDQINERLGTNDPLPTQYVRLLEEHGDVRLRRLVPAEQAGVRP